MGSQLAAQESNSRDWNAAVNYWQAFGLMPEWTEEEKKLRESLPAEFSASLPSGVKELTERSGAALNALEPATRIEKCDWQLDISQGPMLVLPHLQKARELARQSDLRARYRFSQGDSAGGVDDIFASLRLSRAVGKDPILISMLVQIAIERGSMNLAAAYLPQLNEAERKQLLDVWQQSNATSAFVDSLRMEKKVFGGWLKAEFERATAGKRADESAGDFLKTLGLLAGTESNPETKGTFEDLSKASVEMARKAIEEYHADCDKMIRIGGLDFAQRRVELAKFEQELQKSKEELKKAIGDKKGLGRQLSLLLLPAILGVSEKEEAWVARGKLFEVALKGIGGGEAGLAAAAKEMGMKVDYVAKANGFELSTPLTKEGEVEKLSFGGGFRAAK
ncbi:MAG: hypothetical protein ACKO81_16620 [Planctomycetota bacterium]